MNNNIIKFLTAGHVDDGKSTLTGRLLYDTGSIYNDQIDQVKKINDGEIDYSLFVEGLESERKQKITIDVAYRYFSHKNIKFIIADAPGHEQYTKNMAVAAANSNLAIILIDARNGVKTQTIRHTYISYLFGIRNFIIVINKMDLVNYDKSIFNKIKNDYLKRIESFNLYDIDFVPISAIFGENIVKKSKNMSYYSGDTLLNILCKVKISQKISDDLRFPVQSVIKYKNTRFYQGTISSGNVKIGDEISVFPSQKSAIINKIHHSGKESKNAKNADSIAIELDREIDIDRGSIIFKGKKPYFNNNLNANIVWFSKSEFDLSKNKEILIKINHNMILARILNINYLVNIDDLSHYEYDYINQNQIANIDIELSQHIPFDNFDDNKSTGSFLLIDKQNNESLACGLISNKKEDKDVKIKNKNEDFIIELANLVKKHFGDETYSALINGLKNNDYNI